MNVPIVKSHGTAVQRKHVADLFQASLIEGAGLHDQRAILEFAQSVERIDAVGCLQDDIAAIETPSNTAEPPDISYGINNRTLYNDAVAGRFNHRDYWEFVSPWLFAHVVVSGHGHKDPRRIKSTLTVGNPVGNDDITREPWRWHELHSAVAIDRDMTIGSGYGRYAKRVTI